jgi:hypothetical protein
MPGLPERKIEIVRTLVESAPDKVVGGLQAALAAASGDTALAGVRRLVENEVADRRLRNAVFEPIAPLCVGDGKGEGRLLFPARTLSLIWRALKAQAPAEVAEAARALVDFRPDETSPEPFDALVALALEGLRAGEQLDYLAAMDAAEQSRPEGGRLLMECLDLAPIIRGATLRTPEWISRMTEERSAAARIAYKDADSRCAEGGPRFFEMLSAQLAQPWTVLRIVSGVMDRPTERYMAASELSIFATRLMDEVDANLQRVIHFDLNGGPNAGLAAGAVVELITQQIAELENAIDLGREGGWGGRVHKQKSSLASAVEGRLREVDKVMEAALPTQGVRVARVMRRLPRFSLEPDQRAADRIRTLLTFAESVRTSANYGGFASTRAKMIEKTGDTLDHYVDEALALIRENLVEDAAIARQFLDIAADCAALLREPRAGDLVRRRTSSAFTALREELEAAPIGPSAEAL